MDESNSPREMVGAGVNNRVRGRRFGNKDYFWLGLGIFSEEFSGRGEGIGEGWAIARLGGGVTGLDSTGLPPTPGERCSQASGGGGDRGERRWFGFSISILLRTCSRY